MNGFCLVFVFVSGIGDNYDWGQASYGKTLGKSHKQRRGTLLYWKGGIREGLI